MVDREKRRGGHRPRTSENQARLSYDLKNYGLDLGECYPARPSKTLLDLHNSSDHAQPHSIIVKYILDPSAYGFGNAPESSGKLCAGVAKIWLFGPHSACS